MKVFSTLFIGIIIGVLSIFIINKYYFFLEDKNKLIVDLYEKDDSDDYEEDNDEINRVIIRNNKISIEFEKDDILLSGIRHNTFSKTTNAFNTPTRVISISASPFLSMVNEYDILNVYLKKEIQELKYLESKLNRLSELYEAKGSVALKDIEKVKFEFENTNLNVTEVKLKMQILLNNIQIKFGKLMVNDVKTDRVLYYNLLDKNASFLLLENINIEESYLVDKISLTFLTQSIDKKSLIGNVGLYYIENKYYIPNQKLIAYSSSNNGISGLLIPESALVYFQGKMWIYVYDAETSLFTREPINKIIYKTNNEVFISLQMNFVNIVIEGAQILLAEEFRSQIMREDDD